jgi:carboxyl-terminal processing protease
MDRIGSHPTFNAIKASSLLLEKANEKVYSLQLSKYREEQKQLRDSFKKIDDTSKELKSLQVNMLETDEKRLSADNDKIVRRKQWISALSKDIYVQETSKVVTDMIRQGLLVMQK